MSSQHAVGKGRIVYAALDFLLAIIYLVIFLKLVPSRSAAFTAVAVFFSGVMAAGGVGMLAAGRRWGQRVAVISALLMVCVCIVLLLLLLSSAAYLHGIYNGVGQAGAVLALIAAALTIELVGLLPALQLGYLWRHRGAVAGARGR